MTLQAPISDYNPQSLLCQSYYRYPGIKPGFTDLIHPQELHQYHPIFREIFGRVQEEKQNAKNKEEESYYYRFAQIWNQEYANIYGRIPPSVTKDRNTKKGTEYEWGTRDMAQIWPLFGISFSFYAASETPRTIKETKGKVKKIVDISALETITSFRGEVIKDNSLLRIDYSDLRRHWKKHFGKSLGMLPLPSDLPKYPEIKKRIAELLMGTYVPAEHIEMENIGVQEEGIGQGNNISEPEKTVAAIPPETTRSTGIISQNIYSESEYNAFRQRCNNNTTIKSKYYGMIPLREEIAKIGVLKGLQYTSRMSGKGIDSQMIKNAIRIFTDILEDS